MGWLGPHPPRPRGTHKSERQATGRGLGRRKRSAGPYHHDLVAWGQGHLVGSRARGDPVDEDARLVAPDDADLVQESRALEGDGGDAAEDPPGGPPAHRHAGGRGLREKQQRQPKPSVSSLQTPSTGFPARRGPQGSAARTNPRGCGQQHAAWGRPMQPGSSPVAASPHPRGAAWLGSRLSMPGKHHTQRSGACRRGTRNRASTR